jgi:hypothetical protein
MRDKVRFIYDNGNVHLKDMVNKIKLQTKK